MTPRIRASLQSSVLDRIKATAPKPPTDAEIAASAGCDRTLVSRWRSGEREIGLTELLNLAAAFGAEVVWGPMVEVEGCEVVARARKGRVSTLRTEGAALQLDVAQLGLELQRALSDGVLSSQERDQLQKLILQARLRLNQLDSGVKP